MDIAAPHPIEVIDPALGRPTERSRSALFTALLAGLLVIAFGTAAPARQPNRMDLKRLSLEELMELEITSVSKTAEPLSGAAAAIFVLTQEDIRRSGATSVPELLRMVPGVEVARIDANKWAISARGFNYRYANKLLVLVDGRSVYTLLFSGVYWDAVDPLLDDIERIEVIRGPGASLWGANAVNGVINIITKSSAETQGALLTGGGGTEERAFGGVRWGGKTRRGTAYRLYAKYFDRDGGETESGEEGADGLRAGRAGFRADASPGEGDRLTLQGDVFRGLSGGVTRVSTLTPPFTQRGEREIDASGGNLLGRWRRVLAPRSEFTFQAYFDWTHRDEDGALTEDRDTLDLDFQHHLGWGTRQEITWGLGYRYTQDEIDPTFSQSLDPERRRDHHFSAFVQDEIALVPSRFSVFLGSKFERNAYTGVEVQPSARAVWTPSPRHTLWGAVSRAVRTPSRFESDFRINFAVVPGEDLTVLSALGSDDLESEKLLAWEIGYRIRPAAGVWFDAAAFYNEYRDLVSNASGTPFFEVDPPPAHLVVPLVVANGQDAESWGVELAADVRPVPWWRLHASYTYLRIRAHTGEVGPLADPAVLEGSSPRHQARFRSLLDLPGNVELDALLRYVDELRALEVEAYVELDLRLGWRPTPGLEVALVGQNLLRNRHEEFRQVLGEVEATEVGRGVYGKATWRF